jgi:type I restriction enzyme S subunit
MALASKAWGIKKVEELASYITVGFVGSMSSLFVEDGVPLLRGQNIRPYALDLTNLKYISPATHKKWKKSALFPGDVVIVRVGYPGTACVIPEGVGDLNAASLVIVRPDPLKLDSQYLCYVLNSPWGKARIQGSLVGAAQQVFNTHTAASLEIATPPLPEQKRIAEILSAYNELIENSQRRIKILETMARKLYREWFVHFRYPGHQNTPLIPSSLGDIPKGWEVKKLGEIMELNYGKSLKKEDRRDGKFPVYGSSGIVGTHDSKLVEGPGIIVGRKGNVGSVFWCDDDFYVIDTAYFVTSSLPLRFLFYVLPTLNFINSDAAVPGLSRNQAYTLDILVPSSDLLTRFCELADTFETQVATLQRQIQNLRKTRDLLLPRLLSGQIPLHTPTPKPHE